MSEQVVAHLCLTPLCPHEVCISKVESVRVGLGSRLSAPPSLLLDIPYQRMVVSVTNLEEVVVREQLIVHRIRVSNHSLQLRHLFVIQLRNRPGIIHVLEPERYILRVYDGILEVLTETIL